MEWLDDLTERVSERVSAFREWYEDRRAAMGERVERAESMSLGAKLDGVLRVRFRFMVWVCTIYGFASLGLLAFLYSDSVYLNLVLASFTVPVSFMMFHYRHLLLQRLHA